MIVVGEPGSGKTHFVLKRVEEALRSGRGGKVLLVTPTSSMARHLTHQLARRGLAVPGNVVIPIAALVERLTPSLKTPTAIVDSWLLEQAVAQAGESVFGSLSRSPGLLRRAKSAIDELQAAGCTPEAAKRLARTAQQRALAASYDVYQTFLDTYDFVSAPRRRIEAAQEAALHGMPGTDELIFDGFWDFSVVERDLLRSLRNSGKAVVVTTTPRAARHFADWQRTDLTDSRRPSPRRVIVAAPGTDQEVEEVARRIIGANRPWREMGVLLRTPDTYASTIDAAFRRFGIPYRLRQARPLSQHPAAALLREVLSAIGDGFPGDQMLRALRRPAFRLSSHPHFDRFDFDVQKRLPGAGLEFLLQDAPVAVQEALKCLETSKGWERRKASPTEWSADVQELGRKLLMQPVVGDRLSAAEVLELRTWGRAVAALNQALSEAAGFLEFRVRLDCRFSEFLAAFDRALESAELVINDDRRDVVNVLSVHEARQWEIPVVFVCGMVEGQFPAELTEDLFFPEAERTRLGKLGVALRTRADRIAGERLLFEIAASRASDELVLSYPEADGAGSPLLRSFFLDGSPETDLKAHPVRPVEQASTGPTPNIERLAGAAARAIQDKQIKFSPSGLEQFLRCPYEFFASHSLRLQERPGRVVDRLDPRECGSVIHAVLAEWSKDTTRAVGEILDEVFAAKMAELHLQAGFRVAMIQDSLRRDLERFVEEVWSRPLPGLQAGGAEEDVGYLMEEGPAGEIWVRGKVDRYDTVEGGLALVIDYKHSTPDRIKKLTAGHEAGKNLQGPLYLTGLQSQLGLEPAGMLFCSLKQETTLGGWVREGILPSGLTAKGVEVVKPAQLDSIVARGVEAAAEAGARIRSGEIAVDPDDPGHCGKFCSFSSVCRVEL